MTELIEPIEKQDVKMVIMRFKSEEYLTMCNAHSEVEKKVGLGKLSVGKFVLWMIKELGLK